MLDVIQIHGLRVVGRHGVLDFEKASAQPFEIDVDIHVDVSSAGVSDQLGDTIDYGGVISEIAEMVTTESHQLLERLAQRIADVVLGHAGAQAVDVTVRKLRPPVPHDLKYAGVKIHRARGATS